MTRLTAECQSAVPTVIRSNSGGLATPSSSDTSSLPVCADEQERLMYILENEDSVKSLVAGFLHTNNKKHVETLNLLSALCVCSADGYVRVLQTFDGLKKWRGDRYRFQVLVDSMRSVTDSPTHAAQLALVNCLVFGAEGSHERMRLRNELIGLKLLPILERLRTEYNGISADFMKQLEVFDQALDEDTLHLSGPEGVDLTSHVDVFFAILRQVANTPHEMHFLTILQHLLQVGTEEELSDTVWELAEKLMSKAKLIDSKEDAQKLLRLHTSTPKACVREARVGCCMCHCHSSPLHETSAPQKLTPPDGTAHHIPVAPPPPPALKLVAAPASPLLLRCGASEPSAISPDTNVNAATKLSPENGHAMLGPSSNLPSPCAPGHAAALPLSGVTNGLPPVLPQQQVPEPRAKMKQFSWNKVPATKVLASGENVWARAASQLERNKAAWDSFSYDHLEELFGMSSINASENGAPAVALRKRELNQVNLLEGKRSMNVNIFISQFKGRVEDLLALISAGDGSAIGLEKLKGLLRILPELDEIETLTAFSGDRSKLGQAERFFLSLIQVSHYKLRIESLVLREEFVSVVDYVKPSLEYFIVTAKELKANQKLQQVMVLVLMAGNYLNSGTHAGNAAGFRLTSLAKLVEVKANRPRVTLLHVIAMEAEKRDPRMLEFPRELKYLEEASRVSLDTIRLEIQNLHDKTDRISRQVAITSCVDILNQMNTFLDYAREALNDLHNDLDIAERLRIELAHFFCEDIQGFKLDDCFKSLNLFCQRFAKAADENAQRRVQEAKADLRRKMKEQQLAKKGTRDTIFDRLSRAESQSCTSMNKSTSLATRYRSASEVTDITLPVYFHDDDADSTVATMSRASDGRDPDSLVSFLESGASTLTRTRPGSLRIRQRRSVAVTTSGAWQTSNDRERAGTSAVNVPFSWRQRFEQKMHEDGGTTTSGNAGTAHCRSVADIGNVASQEAHAPIFSKRLEGRKEQVRMQSVTDLRDAESGCTDKSKWRKSELNVSNEDAWRPPLCKQERHHKTQSLLLAGACGATDDLGQLLDSVEIGERNRPRPEGNVIGRRTKGGSSSLAVDAALSLVAADKSVVSYEEVVQHCERTRDEIDRMGTEKTPNEQRNSTWQRGQKSMRDSGIEDPAQISPHRGENKQLVSDSLVGEVSHKNDQALVIDVPVPSGVSVPSPVVEPSCVAPTNDVQSKYFTVVVDHSSDDACSETSPETTVDVSQQELRDEAYETESHSTLCSVGSREKDATDAVQQSTIEQRVHSGARSPSKLGTKSGSTTSKKAPTVTTPVLAHARTATSVRSVTPFRVKAVLPPTPLERLPAASKSPKNPSHGFMRRLVDTLTPVRRQPVPAVPTPNSKQAAVVSDSRQTPSGRQSKQLLTHSVPGSGGVQKSQSSSSSSTASSGCSPGRPVSFAAATKTLPVKTSSTRRLTNFRRQNAQVAAASSSSSEDDHGRARPPRPPRLSGTPLNSITNTDKHWERLMSPPKAKVPSLGESQHRSGAKNTTAKSDGAKLPAWR